MELDGKPIDAAKKYKVAGWAPVSEDAKAAGGEPIWDVVARYLRAQKSIPPRTLEPADDRRYAGQSGDGIALRRGILRYHAPMLPTPRAPSLGLRAAASLMTLAVCALATTIAMAQSAPAIPAKPGEALGTVQLGKTTVTLKYAYASGPEGAGAPSYQIMLTDGPVPPDVLAKGIATKGANALLRSGKLSGISMLVDATGFLYNIIPFVGDLQGSKMLGSAGRLDKFAVTPAGLTGQGRMDAAGTNQGWSYSASFNATVQKP